jgi:hypothetical protein
MFERGQTPTLIQSLVRGGSLVATRTKRPPAKRVPFWQWLARLFGRRRR